MTTEQDEGPFAGLDRASRAIAVIGGALAELGEDRRWLIPWVAEGVADRSIAPEILAFATGPTAGCSSGRACARLTSPFKATRSTFAILIPRSI